MKTLKQTLELANQLVMKSTENIDTYFVYFSGHVNRLDVDVYRLGYDRKDVVEKQVVYNGYLNTDTEIQLAYFSLLKELEK